MDIIYEPKGKAKEYADLSLNIYKGCTHGCKYCYIPQMPWVDRKDYYSDANPKADILEKLSKDIKSLKRKFNGNCPEILLSFQGDVYQPLEMELGITTRVLQMLIENDFPFSILTKGGTRAVRDFDLLESYSRARFGTTLVFTDQKDADEWEPGAASIKDRIDAIREAHKRGILTWISLEPVIIPDQALQLIDKLHPIIDHWKVGKINYVKNNVDWIAFREQVTELLDSAGADYYLKKSLTSEN